MAKKLILLSALYNQGSVIDDSFDEKWVGDGLIEAVPEKARKVLILWGGEDISPSIYGHTPAKLGQGGIRPSFRDQAEIKLARRAIEMGIPIIGVCRGAQMMCALSGGSLIQHVSGHFGNHPIITDTGQLLETNSIHHQMMNLSKVDHKLLAWVPKNISKTYIGQDDNEIADCWDGNFREPEIAWIPKSRALCIQGHPEYFYTPNDFTKLVSTLVKQYVIPSCTVT